MMIPTLKTHFAPKRGLTEAVVHRLVNGLDKRRNIYPEAARGVLCGILAMRGVDEFVVNRAELTKEEGKAFPSFTGFRLRREVNRSHFAHSRPLYEAHGFGMVRISSREARLLPVSSA